MTKQMGNQEEAAGIIGGLVGGISAIHLMGITWETAWSNLGHLLWVGFVALFTGAMGALGTHLVKKYIIKNKSNGTNNDQGK